MTEIKTTKAAAPRRTVVRGSWKQFCGSMLLAALGWVLREWLWDRATLVADSAATSHVEVLGWTVTTTLFIVLTMTPLSTGLVLSLVSLGEMVALQRQARREGSCAPPTTPLGTAAVGAAGVAGGLLAIAWLASTQQAVQASVDGVRLVPADWFRVAAQAPAWSLVFALGAIGMIVFGALLLAHAAHRRT